MNTKLDSQTFYLFQDVASQFASCMNDFLYVYNIPEDIYYIAEGAVERFLIPSSTFGNVVETLSQFVYPEDFPLLQEDLMKIMRSEKNEHNLRYRWLGKNGEPIWINCRGTVLRNEQGIPYLMIGCINEIGVLPNADNVSGLLRESALEEQLMRSEDLSSAHILRIGIDDFKSINERLGIEYGNLVLHEVANCIQNCLYNNQFVYRLASDEFFILDKSGCSIQDMKSLYHTIRSSVDDVVERNGYVALYTISGGIVPCSQIQPLTYDEIMKLSEFAVNNAKRLGKNQVYCFQAEDYDRFLRRKKILQSMHRSVSNGFKGFALYYQPIISATDEQLFAAEALLRYTTQEGEPLSPAEFIPILEESGLIIPVGKWVITTAAAMCRECQKHFPDFKVTVNLSYIQLLKSPLFDDVMEILNVGELLPSGLIVELTESGHLENSTAVQNVWRKFRNAGIQIAIDDFGTGYSNLQNIGALRPNIVKIDRSFTIKSLHNDYERQLLSHIIHMVHSIGLKLVVEGIEDEQELAEITSMNPDYIQGYYYSRPCPQTEFFEKFIY